MVHPDDLAVDEILWLLSERQKPASRYYYAPLDPARRKVVRAHYLAQLNVPLIGEDGVVLHNQAGTIIARGYDRVVVGDYGAFIEFSEAQAVRENLGYRFGQPGRGAQKYQWLVTLDDLKTKVYEQLGTVSYADYKVGYYYVDPADVVAHRSRG